MNNMRKEIVMSEQEFNNLKKLITIAKDSLEDEGKDDSLTGNGWYVLEVVNKAYDLLVGGWINEIN